MVNKKIQLDFTEEGLREKIEVVQGDTGRVLLCNIIGVDMTNVSARFYAVKKSGKEIYNNCTVSKNTVTIELTEQTLAEVGIVKCQLDLRKGDQKVQSFIFDIDVTASLMAQSEYLSSDEYKVVDDLADKVEKNENKIAELDDKKANKDDYGSPLKAKTVAEMTDKKKVYVYVGTETGYINGNWYTWEETAWVSGGVYNSAAIQTDETLTQSGKAADSAIVGQQIGSLKESLKDINVETDKTLTEEDKPADAKMTGKKISELSKNIEDEKNKNVVTLISKEDFKVIEDSEEITDENKLYSFNSAFSANFIISTNNKYLLSVDDSGQFTANFVKENTEKILLSAFKIESFPEVSNIIYVSLGRQPENDVTLQITSDSNVILSATELTFTKENFFIPQPVSISSNTKTTSIVKIIGKETATIDLIVSGNIRYLFRNGQYASDITVTTDVGYGGTYSISDNLITLGGTIGLILSGVNLKNGDTIIVNCTNANDSSAHYTALQNGGTMLVTRKASDLYADIQLNGNAQIQYTNTTGSTIPDITIKNSFTKFKGDSIRVIEV